LAACTAAKPLRGAFSEKIAEELGLAKSAAKKIQKALDVAAGARSAAAATRPAYLDAPSGTRDWYPEELRVQKYLFDNMREVARKFDFSEYDAPVLEHTELYRKKAAYVTLVQQCGVVMRLVGVAECGCFVG
jgi:histidyl-tRNA synthetase